MTDEELRIEVAADVKRQLAPKRPAPKQFIPPGKIKHFVETRPMPEHLPSDYARSIVGSHMARSGKKQSLPPLSVYSFDDPETTELVTRMAKNLGRDVQYEDYYPMAEIAYKYEYGKPLLRPDQLPHLQTQMRRLHEWYMQSCRESQIWLIAAVRDEHYFRGDDEIHIEFEELFQLFKQDALDKSLISCYCL